MRTMTRSLQACGLAFMLGLATAPAAHPSTTTEVLVQEDAVLHQLSDSDPATSTATLSYVLGSAWAEASIPDGTLKTYAHTTTSDVAGSHGAAANAYAKSEDWYTLAGVPAGSMFWLTGRLHVVGHLATNPATSNVAYAVVTADFGAVWSESLWSVPGGEVAIDEQLTDLFFVRGGEPFRVVAELSSYAQGFRVTNALSDFWGTARIAFDLPDGATISSQNGYFQSASVVPEPAAVFVLGSGLIGLIRLARYRRR